MFGNLSQAYSRIGADTGLFVVCSFRQILQQVTIYCAIRQLGDDNENRLYGLLAHDRCGIGETGDLEFHVRSGLGALTTNSPG